MRNEKTFQFKTIVIIMLVLFTSTTGAETLVFNTSDNQFDTGINNQGWWSDTREARDDNDNYLTGISFDGDHRSFFTFDLSSLSLVVTDALLELRRYQYQSSADSENLGLFDVSTDASILNNNVGTSFDIYNDLGSGISYGEFEIFENYNEDEILSFELNSAAVADINASAGGWFSIGGSLLTIDGSVIGNNVEAIFGASNDGYSQQLFLNVIPEPVSITLFGLVGLLLVKKHRQ